MAKPGVFCIEGNWIVERLQEQATVRPILELLGDDGYKFVHREVGTKADLEYYLSQWRLKKYKNFPVLHLAFHGEPGTIEIGKQVVDIDEISAALAGACAGRVIIFGTCATVDVSTKRLRKFLKETGAIAICGYKGYVNWIQSTAFELALIHTFLRRKCTRVTVRSMAAEARKVSRPFKLGFRCITKYDP